MSWWPWTPQQQLDRIESAVEYIETIITTINRRTIRMSNQEAELNTALVEFFASINAGLDRIEQKLAEQAPQVDLSDETAAIRAAQQAFQARVDVDAPAEPPPA